MASTKASSSESEARRQLLRSIISSSIEANFKSTLGTEPDIVNIFLALLWLESRFNVNAVGKLIPITISQGAKDYYNSPAIQTILSSGTASQKANALDGLKAFGVAQSMGWNAVRGASAKQNKCELERVRPDLASSLCVSPGESLAAKYLGEANLPNAITAGLAILESKWKNCKKSSTGMWYVGPIYFPLRISAAVSAYLGLGAKDVVTGLTPQAYAASIVGGKDYLAANNSSSSIVRDSQVKLASQNESPIITAASGVRARPGCISQTA